MHCDICCDVGRMISSLAWVPKGVAKELPTREVADEEAMKALREQMGRE